MYAELVMRLREAPYDWPDADLHYEAADAIEELETACDQYEKNYKNLCEYLPKWIPVTERLPEKSDCFYLVVLNNWNTDFCLYTKEKGFGMYITPKWWDANDEVTHWMPLPEPPKEEA